ncbi:hypothetical protein CsatB_003266 [Cannabis sativa]
MTMNNPMVSLLTNSKLFGANFVKWRENINIALIGENALFVLTEEAPEQPGENATKAVKEKFLINNLHTFKNLIGGPQKGGTKAPSSCTANGTAKAEANIAYASKPSNKKNWKNSKKPLKAVKMTNKKKAANPNAKPKRKVLLLQRKGPLETPLF